MGAYKLDHDFVVSSTERKDPSWSDNTKVSDFLINIAINGRFPQGTKDRSTQRQIKRIQDTIDRAIQREKTEVELSISDVEFILDTFKDHSCHPSHSSWFIDLYDYTDKWVEAAKKAKSDADAKPENKSDAKSESKPEPVKA